MRYLTNKEYGIFLGLAGITYGICGVITNVYIQPGEPWWARLPLVAPCMIMAAYVFKSELPEKTARNTVYAFLFLGTAQYLYYSTVNGLNYFYACGLFPLASACIIVINIRNVLLTYLIILNIMVTMITLFFDDNRFYLLLFNFYSFSIIMYVFQIQKINFFNRLALTLDNLKSSKKEIENTYSLNLQAAHDLGSPVSAINIVADKIKYDDPKLYRMLETSVNRINDISADLLSSHKKQSEIVESHFFDLENNISQLVNDKRKEYQDIKNFFIFYRVTAPLLQEVNIPKSEFHRVFSNLINNSLDAMKERNEKRIKMVITPHDEFTEIIVSDNGCGIDEDKVDQIFMENVSFKKHGTGLGLSYAKKTVEKWGGSIQLLKTSPSGTSFRLMIPNH